MMAKSDEILERLTGLVENQQRQIDDVHRLLVTLTDAVVSQRDSNLASALDRVAGQFAEMNARGEKFQTGMLKRLAEQREVAERVKQGQNP